MKYTILILLASLASINVMAKSAEPANNIDSASYYFIKQDLRRCAAPRCGGIFVQSVNRTAMRCPNGERALQCYIGTANYNALGFNPFELARPKMNTLLVSGSINVSRESHSSLQSVLIVHAAYARKGKSSEVGKVWSLKGGSSRCITQPCFYGEASMLNSAFKRSFSDYDLSKAGLSPEQIESVKKQFAIKEPVLARAIRRSYKTDGARGIRFVPTELYFPVKQPKVP